MTRRSGTFERMLAAARLKRGTAIVGVCNVTPDSFSDGGKHFAFADACRRVDELLAEGADAVDIGAESTRPGARSVSPAEQLSRLLEVVRYAASRSVVSIDTTSPEVAAACLEAGACAVNDVSCLADRRLARVVRDAAATLILMHSRGSQTDMRGFGVYPEDGYGDVVADVLAEWNRAAVAATAEGLSRSSLVMDPGLGFAKSARQSMELVVRTGELVGALDVPVLVGASRKSLLKLVDADAAPTERLGASVAVAAHVSLAGAQLVRVHDVRDTRQTIDFARMMSRGRPVP